MHGGAALLDLLAAPGGQLTVDGEPVESPLEASGVVLLGRDTHASYIVRRSADDIPRPMGFRS